MRWQQWDIMARYCHIVLSSVFDLRIENQVMLILSPCNSEYNSKANEHDLRKSSQ